MGSVDLPDQPDEPSRAERARGASAARSQMREMPDPNERGRAYEATRAHVSAETADATEHGRYWDEVPRAVGATARRSDRLSAGAPDLGARIRDLPLQSGHPAWPPDRSLVGQSRLPNEPWCRLPHRARQPANG